MSAEGGRGGRGGRTGRRGGDGLLGEGKVVLVLDPGVDAGIAGRGGVGEELSEEEGVGGVVFGHGHCLHVLNPSPRVETSAKKRGRLDAILSKSAAEENHINGVQLH